MYNDVWVPSQVDITGVGNNPLDTQRTANVSGNHVRIIRNTEGDAWATVQNRLSCPVGIGIVPSQGSTLLSKHLIPGLTVESVAIDPEQDVGLVLGAAQQNLRGRNAGVNDAANGIRDPSAARTVRTLLLPHGSAFSRRMYPIESAPYVTRSASVVAGGSATHTVSPNDFVAPTVQLILPNTGFTDYPDEVCIIGIFAVLTALGAASLASDMIVTGLISSSATPMDIAVFPGSAAGAAGLLYAPPIMPVPGLSAIRFTNTGTATITVLYTVWLGIPDTDDYYQS